MVTGWALTRAPSKSRSLPIRHWCQSCWSCHESMRWPAPSSLLLQPSRERQIHVVAAEQDVLADGDAAQRERAALLADRDEAEVGGAAADVAHQHEVADLHALAPGVALRGEPRVERRLRLFEEAHARQAGLRALPGASAPGPPRRTRRARSRAPPGRRAPRRRRRARAATRAPGAPGTRADANTGDTRRTSSGRLPRQDVGGPVHARVREPRLRRRHQAGRILGAALARELADHRVGLAAPTATRSPRPQNPPDPAGTGTTAGAWARRPRRD